MGSTAPLPLIVCPQCGNEDDDLLVAPPRSGALSRCQPCQFWLRVFGEEISVITGPGNRETVLQLDVAGAPQDWYPSRLDTPGNTYTGTEAQIYETAREWRLTVLEIVSGRAGDYFIAIPEEDILEEMARQAREDPDREDPE